MQIQEVALIGLCIAVICIVWGLSFWQDDRHRKDDIATFWPACKRSSPTIREARAAFAAYVCGNPSWDVLSHAEVLAIIQALN